VKHVGGGERRREMRERLQSVRYLPARARLFSRTYRGSSAIFRPARAFVPVASRRAVELITDEPIAVLTERVEN
jgi:hypothetical protein